MAAIIIEPPPENFEAEHRSLFFTQSPSGPHVTVQGSVRTGDFLRGNAEDSEDISDMEYDVRLLVGPFWRDVQTVVPSVTVNGFWNSDADDDDQQKWDVQNLTWDTVGELGPNNEELRIRLRFTVLVRGQSSRIVRLGYYLFARARNLGIGGLTQPGPVKNMTPISS